MAHLRTRRRPGPQISGYYQSPIEQVFLPSVREHVRLLWGQLLESMYTMSYLEACEQNSLPFVKNQRKTKQPPIMQKVPKNPVAIPSQNKESTSTSMILARENNHNLPQQKLHKDANKNTTKKWMKQRWDSYHNKSSKNQPKKDIQPPDCSSVVNRFSPLLLLPQALPEKKHSNDVQQRPLHGKLAILAKEYFCQAYGLESRVKKSHAHVIAEAIKETHCSQRAVQALLYGTTYNDQLQELRELVPNYKPQNIRDTAFCAENLDFYNFDGNLH